MGRMFDFHLLDLLEMGIENFRSMRSFGAAAAAAALGSKPCTVFTGDLFETDSAMKLAKSVLLDFFRGRVVPNINLKVRPASRSAIRHPLRLFRLSGSPRAGRCCVCHVAAL